MAKSWDPKITDGACINGPSLFISTAVANIKSDVLLLALPIHPLVNLQMPTRRKIGLVVMFTAGVFIVEANLLIICAAFSTLKKLVGEVVPNILGGTTYERGTIKAPTGLVRTSELPRPDWQELSDLEHNPPGKITRAVLNDGSATLVAGLMRGWGGRDVPRRCEPGRDPRAAADGCRAGGLVKDKTMTTWAEFIDEEW
ncbi:hypothetical protein CMUS01_08423 [Colletotrichum musicola]|uniref:Rhodopsin domain-containing protein n=1 Tax=Colletotrichum musicola TaxID=2175873 RepID=A0A8H6NDF3_9PEZI|nr:hypothetical protein CMUS01_08423 [Colletotrichum musicola]